MKLFVLGAGGIGTLVTSAVCNRFPVTFIVRSQKKIEYMAQNKNCFQINRLFDGKQKEFQIDSVKTSEQVCLENAFIPFLIVCVKTIDTVKSLKPLLKVLDERSKILFIQNGMGVLEELYSTIWPIAGKRPTIYHGVISHGVWQDKSKWGTFDYNHAGSGTLEMSKVPDNKNSSDEIDDVLLKILDDKEIHAKYLNYNDLLVLQIIKLMVNACINSTTSIIDCVNHEPSGISITESLYKDIITEGLSIIKKSFPSVKDDPRLSIEKVYETVVYLGFTLNGKNSSSMREDTKAIPVREVEVDYINGYICKLANNLGLSAPINETIRKLVLLRVEINKKRLI